MKLVILILVVMSPMISMAQMNSGNPSLMDIHERTRNAVGKGGLSISSDLISQARGYNNQNNCQLVHGSGNIRENLFGTCSGSTTKAMQNAADGWASEKSKAPRWPFSSWAVSYGHYANMLFANSRIGCHACTKNGCIVVRCLYN